MSIGSSLTGITFGGLASGIDSDSIISRLMQIENIPVQRLQNQQIQLNARMGVLQQFKSTLTNLSVAAGGLNSAAAFNPISATSSVTDVATITADSTTGAGIYNLAVSKLAQSHKISSAAQADTTTALNQSGTMIVDGKSVKIESSDTLRTIAQKINSSGASATASVIDGGAGKAFLTITSSKSGAANKVQIADLQGTVANNLHLVGGADTLRESISGGYSSYNFSSASSTLASQWSVSGLGSSSFTVNGVNVTVDMSTATLQSIAGSINAAGAGVTATVRTVTDKSGATSYKLDLAGLTTAVDSDGALKAIGVMQQGYSTELVQAQDAAFKIDGVDMTSDTNVVTTVIPGATITLLKADVTTPPTSVLTLSRDDSAIVKKVKEFADAFNGVIDFVKQNTAFDKDTFQSGILFGDGSTQQVESSISNAIFSTVTGLSTPYSNLAQLGFSFDTDGKLQVDEGKLSTAISANPGGVAGVFRAMGTTNINTLSYISGSDKTVASGAAGYLVNITQAATKSNYTAEIQQTDPLALTERLTFNGALFGSTAYTLDLPAGSTQTDIVNRINSDAKLKDLVTASVVGGQLKLDSKKWGAPGDFTVTSNIAADIDSSGIGFASGTKVVGVDVAGTINGEAATGSGQYLTGKTGNAKTEGLQIQYTGSTTGAIGNVVFSKGIGAQMSALVGTFTDSVNGLLPSNDKALQSQVDSISSEISDLQSRLKVKEQSLREKFSRMETAIAQLQSQQSRLSALR